MVEFSTLGTFVVVVLGLFLIPGPAVLLVLTRTVQGGRKTGIMTGLGVATGDFVHTMCAAIGLSAVLMTSAFAFSIVKYVGAAYLVYLGVRAILEKPAKPATTSSPATSAMSGTPASAEVLSQGVALNGKPAGVSPLKAYLQAIPAEVLNPKTALFFLAFLPQFVRPEQGSTLSQFLTLGLVFVAMSAAYTTLLVLSIRPLGRIVKRLSWLSRWQGKIIGTIFISLGLKVAAQHR
ncbi:Threonine/homoserine/homoserine lactone efflux protein [Pararobbsia alpina]|uniref:LysE family translocator n=1 Tax=Pararobbsia alpina TaxID=621374 RepID=UPI0039A6376A